MADLDLLGKNIIGAISQSSVFTFEIVKTVYLRVKSFDKTIDILKMAVSRATDPIELSKSFLAKPPDKVNFLEPCGRIGNR